jgi:hypothetical protein
MFLGRKVKWLDQATFEQEQCWNWQYRACDHVDVFPDLDPRPIDEYSSVLRPRRNLPSDQHSVRCAVQLLLSAQEYLQQTSALDWVRDFFRRRGPQPRWYLAGLGSSMLNTLGLQRALSCLLRLPAVRARAESVTRARNLEARAALARFFRGHVDVIANVMQHVE